MSTLLSDFPAPISTGPGGRGGMPSATPFMGDHHGAVPTHHQSPFPPSGGDNRGNGGQQDDDDMSRTISGLMRASADGLTRPPSAPMQSPPHMDPAAHASFVPPPRSSGYISDYAQNDRAYRDHQRMIQDSRDLLRRNQAISDGYDELKLPVLYAFLFFLFQLPLIQNILILHGAAHFTNDGAALNLTGLAALSAMFGAAVYLFHRFKHLIIDLP